MDLRLFHISDVPGIKRFDPRPSTRQNAGQDEPIVWAIDAEHLHNYILPRDCPRVTFFADPGSDPEDVTKLMGGTTARNVVAIESIWLSRIQEQCLFRYEFNPETFILQEATAGYWISRLPVAPIEVIRIDDILGVLLQYDVELRILPSLWMLREHVIKSTLGYSIIRMSKAQIPPEGLSNYHPLP